MEFIKSVIELLTNRPDYWPLILWLPLFLGLWALSTTDGGERFLKRLGPALPALAVLMLALFAWFNWAFQRSTLYLGPMSHLQPQIANISWYFANGKPVYHGADSPEIYNLLYGPWLYIITGTFEKILGPGIFAAKLSGELALAGAFVLLFLLLRRQTNTGYALTATGLFAALLMALDPVESLVRADAYITFFLIIGCWAAQSPAKAAPYVFGIMAGICFNFKIHAPIYFFPLLWSAWQAGHRWPSLLKAMAIAAVTVALPFVLFPNISLQNYWWTLRTASGHGMDPFRFLESMEWFFLLGLPIAAVAGLAYVQNPEATGQKLKTLRPFLGLILTAFILLLPFASKFGAGRHHLLPFIVILLLLAGELAPLVRRWFGSTSLVVLGTQAALLSWLGACFAVGMTRSYQDTAWFKASAAWGDSINADLDAVLAKYTPSHVVLMGVGGDKDYIYTFFRTRLVFAGMPDGIEPGPLMEFAAIGNYAPDLNRLATALNHEQPGKKIMWLIPKGNEPFTVSNYYTPVVRGDYLKLKPLFDEHFVGDFKRAYHPAGSTQFYDLYESN